MDDKNLSGDDSPTQPMATGGGPAGGGPAPGEQQPIRAGAPEPGIFCWNCGRQNPRSHAYCLQCGAALAGAHAGTGTGRAAGYRDERGGRTRVAAIGAAMIAVLLLGLLGAMMLLGGNPPPLAASPSPTDAALGSPSIEPSLAPSPDTPASPSAEPPPPTDSPTAAPTATATATPTSAPTATATATAAATATPAPTPADCNQVNSPTHSVALDAANNSRQISASRIWCVTGITFRDGLGDGTLKLSLTNPLFLTDQYGYSSTRVGWNEAFMTGGLFSGSATESPAMLPIDPLLDLSRSLRMFPQGTLVEFEISCNGADPCDGAVRIDYNRRNAPVLP